MRFLTKAIKLLLAALICCSLLFGCAKKGPNHMMYGDIVFDTLDLDKNKLVSEDKKYTSIIRTYDEAELILLDMGVSDSASSVYDENYFASYDLLIVAFATNSVYQYALEKMEMNDNTLTIAFDEKIPKVNTLLQIYKAILIDVPKDNLPNDTEIDVRINQVIEG